MFVVISVSNEIRLLDSFLSISLSFVGGLGVSGVCVFKFEKARHRVLLPDLRLEQANFSVCGRTAALFDSRGVSACRHQVIRAFDGNDRA